MTVIFPLLMAKELQFYFNVGETLSKMLSIWNLDERKTWENPYIFVNLKGRLLIVPECTIWIVNIYRLLPGATSLSNPCLSLLKDYFGGWQLSRWETCINVTWISISVSLLNLFVCSYSCVSKPMIGTSNSPWRMIKYNCFWTTNVNSVFPAVLVFRCGRGLSVFQTFLISFTRVVEVLIWCVW